MIRPWYRSRLFWLGIPGLVFMLWLWLVKAHESFTFGHTSITGPTETTTRSIFASADSIYEITYRKKNNHSLGSPPRGFYWGGVYGPSGHLVRLEPLTWPPPRPFGIFRDEDERREYREIWLAWWVVISAYTTVWFGAVAVWQRRKARLSRRAAAELPGA